MTEAAVEINGAIDDDLSSSLSTLLQKVDQDCTDLYLHCLAFIAKQEIRCAETISQTDRVIENAYEFIEGVCNIVGYHKDEDDD